MVPRCYRCLFLLAATLVLRSAGVELAPTHAWNSTRSGARSRRHGSEKLTLLDEEDYPKAKCLDGSQGGYYFSEGSGDGANKFYIYRHGGAFCGSDEDCKSRSTSALGSSSEQYHKDGHEMEKSHLGFARDPTKNPLLNNWNHVEMIYCDGMYYAGKAEEPVNGLHYKGGWIMEGVIGDLKKKHGMSNATTDVVIAGCSAGAISTVTTIDWVKSLVHEVSPKAKVAGFVSSGFFLDYKHPENDYREKKRYPFEQGNLRGQVSQKCLNVKPKEGRDGHMCLIPEIAAPFVGTPLFFWESLYDSYMLGNNVMKDGKPCDQEKCATDHGLKFEKAMEDLLKEKKEFGAFVSGCSHHCDAPNIETIHGKTPLQAFAEWYGNYIAKDAHSGRRTAIASAWGPWSSSPASSPGSRRHSVLGLPGRWVQPAGAKSRARSSSPASRSRSRRLSVLGLLRRAMRSRQHSDNSGDPEEGRMWVHKVDGKPFVNSKMTCEGGNMISAVVSGISQVGSILSNAIKEATFGTTSSESG